MKKTLIADAHAHVFNAGFLPIQGVLMSRRVPKRIASTIADFIEQEVEKDWPPIPTSSASKTQRKRQRLYEMLAKEITSKARGKAGRPDLIRRVVNRVPDEDLLDLHVALSRFRMAPKRKTRSPALVDDRTILEQLLRGADKKAGEVETGEESVSQRRMSITSLVEWILLLLMHESRIERAYSRAWDGNPRLDCRVHHMMDMENHYPASRVLYSLEMRHDRMRAVAENAELPLLGFAAFDPFRKHCQRIIEDAISSGFSGVKFYPPNGYRPIGNSARDIKKGPPPEVVDERNMELFRFCVRKDVPVFTHCTDGGMESRPRDKTGRFSNPVAWRRVLELDGLSSLRLCFGHAGGQKGWFSEHDEEFKSSWAGEVFKICTNPKYHNVYCDFGFFDQIFSASAVKRFVARLSAAVNAEPCFANRVCFGTDWHIIAQKDCRNYISRFLAMIHGSGTLQPHADKFMRGNLMAYLKMTSIESVASERR